jgi:cardiolipin synthase
MTVTFIVLGIRGAVPVWLVILVIARDLYIVGGLAYLHQAGCKVSIQPTKLSKLNTFCQIFVISLAFAITYLHAEQPPFLYPHLHLLEQALPVAVYVVVCMTIVTGIQYTGLGWSIYKGRVSYADLSVKKS